MLQPADLITKEPPAPLALRHRGPSTPLDHKIIAVLTEADSRPCHAGQIAQKVGAGSHAVSSRLKVLTDRGLIRREAVPNGPRRGPGAFLYRLVQNR
jgi:predicted ArsR family transcriptional regulator